MAEIPSGLDKDGRKRLLEPARNNQMQTVERRLAEISDVRALTEFRAFAALRYPDQLLGQKLEKFLEAIDTRLRALEVVAQVAAPVATEVKDETPAADAGVDLPPKPSAAPAPQAPTPRGPAPSAAPRQPVAQTPVQPQRPAPQPTPPPLRAPVAAAPTPRGPAPAAAPRSHVHDQPVRSSREGR